MSETGLPAAPALLKELSTTAFNQWKHDPVTRIFLGYLLDKAEDYKDFLLAQALSIKPNKAEMKEARARILCLTELQALELNDIHALYGTAKPEDKAPE